MEIILNTDKSQQFNGKSWGNQSYRPGKQTQSSHAASVSTSPSAHNTDRNVQANRRDRKSSASIHQIVDPDILHVIKQLHNSSISLKRQTNSKGTLNLTNINTCRPSSAAHSDRSNKIAAQCTAFASHVIRVNPSVRVWADGDGKLNLNRFNKTIDDLR
jgi:hypothetical protein